MHTKTFLGLIAGLLISIPLLAAEQPFQDQHPERYTVQRGDTLWDISERFLQSPWLWPEIWHVNPEIANPHLIYPGDVIRLVYVDGEPRLTVERGPREVRLSPEVQEEQLEPAISTIPYEAIRPFLSRSVVVDEGFFEDAPYIVAGQDERVMASMGDPVYVRGLPDAVEDNTYAIVRRGEQYLDPETDEVLGREAIYVGDARVTRDGDPATAQVSSSNREVLPGDRLLLLPRQSQLQFVPRAPETAVEGQIIDVLDGVSQIGQFDVVVLNLGTEQGLEAGHVLAIHQTGRTVTDPITEEPVTLPEERAGEAIVFRPFDKVSYALVMRANRHMGVSDMVRNP